MSVDDSANQMHRWFCMPHLSGRNILGFILRSIWCRKWPRSREM